MMKDKEKTVSEIIEEVKTEICDNYCKYPAIYDTREDSSENYDEMMEKICANCPLDRLRGGKQDANKITVD